MINRSIIITLYHSLLSHLKIFEYSGELAFQSIYPFITHVYELFNTRIIILLHSCHKVAPLTYIFLSMPLREIKLTQRILKITAVQIAYSTLQVSLCLFSLCLFSDSAKLISPYWFFCILTNPFIQRRLSPIRYHSIILYNNYVKNIVQYLKK